MFSFPQNGRTREWNRFSPEALGQGREKEGEISQIMYTQVSKCKNDKIKF
jgi:hypothetical protein